MFIYEGTKNLVSGAFLKCFSIYRKVTIAMTRTGLTPSFKSAFEALTFGQ